MDVIAELCDRKTARDIYVEESRAKHLDRVKRRKFKLDRRAARAEAMQNDAPRSNIVTRSRNAANVGETEEVQNSDADSVDTASSGWDTEYEYECACDEHYLRDDCDNDTRCCCGCGEDEPRIHPIECFVEMAKAVLVNVRPAKSDKRKAPAGESLVFTCDHFAEDICSKSYRS